MPRTRRSRAAALALVFVVYFTAGKLGLKLAFVHQSATAVWAPTGIALAALLIFGRWIWPSILLGAFFVNVTTAGSSILTSVAIAIGNTLEGIVGAFLVRRFARGRNAFDRPQDIFKFALLAGICSTATSAIVGVTSLCLAGTATWANYGAIWLTWWLGDAVGDFVVAPVVILWAGRPKPTIDRRDVLHAALLIACLFVISVIVFGKGYPLEFLCIPVLIWAAFRFGPRGAATTSVLLATIALAATLRGFGPFVTHSVNESLLFLQTYIGVSTVMALAVAAVVWDREQVRQQLLRQATELRLVIDGMPGLVSYIDRQFQYRFLNRRYAEWFGRPTEGLVNKTVAEAFGTVLFENIRPYAERALAGEVVTFEHSHSYQGDRLRHVRATYVPDKAEDGLVRGFVVVVEDITEQHQSQESQKALEQQLMLLIEASSTLLASPESPEVVRSILAVAKRFVEAPAYAVWRKTEDSREWRIVAVDGLSEDYQRTISDITGKATSTLREPLIVEDIEEAPLVGDRVAAYRAEGIRALLTIPLRIRDETAGTIVFYYRSPHRFTAIETRIAVALGNLAAAALGTSTLYEQQTTLRQSAESAEQRSRFLAQAGAVLSSSLDYQATLASVADLAVPSFADWASVDVIQESGDVQRLAVKHIDPKKIELAYEYSRRYPPRDNGPTQVALRTGKSVLIEDIPDSLIIERATDEEHARFLRELGVKSVIIAPLVARQRTLGTLTFVTAESGRRYSKVDLALSEELASRAATAVDNARLFTESQRVQEELRRRNDELRRANEDLNQFAYSASHDLREPLRIVVIYSQLLRKNYLGKLDTEADEYLDFTEHGAKRMETLIRDLLAYTQAVNIADEEITPVDAGVVMAKVVSNLKETIRESGAVVTYGVLPVLRVHEIHLLQLFQNLVENSIKYRGEQPPCIEITSERLAGNWKISVRDNGIGIPSKYAQTVFGLFKRLHSSSQYTGTGIGLAICQKIVDRYGGRIWVESEEGQGSIFYFTLPRAD